MRRILVAYDGSDPARRALLRAAELSLAMGATVTVLNVAPAHADRAAVDIWSDEQARSRVLGEATRLLAEQGVSSNVLERAGDPGPAIVQAADQGGFDTIIVGSRGLGVAARLVLGSVSEYVATHARATVVVVH